jgi:hypothetical protein
MRRRFAMKQAKTNETNVEAIIERSKSVGGVKALDDALRRFGMLKQKFEMRVSSDRGLMAPVPFSKSK